MSEFNLTIGQAIDLMMQGKRMVSNNHSEHFYSMIIDFHHVLFTVDNLGGGGVRTDLNVDFKSMWREFTPPETLEQCE